MYTGVKWVGQRVRFGISMLAVVGVVLPLVGQQAVSSRRDEIEQLKNEMKQIEARLAALEASEAANERTALATKSTPQAPLSSISAGQTAPQQPASTGPEAVKEAEAKGMDTMDAGMGGETVNIPHLPQLKIRGFGDVRAFVADQNFAVIGSNPAGPMVPSQAGDSTFALGLMDLFVTSEIANHFSYLSEIAFEAEEASNEMGVDLERAQISYTPSEKFSFTAGRTHSMLGYYNTAFHHGTWFQTTIDRPRIFNFEDLGGPLPVHNVGISLMGKLPSGSTGLHWFAEVGNGKQSHSLQATATPANVLADHTGKSTNIGVYVRPDWLSGLQTGFNWYHASLVPIVSSLPSYGTPAFPFPDAASYYKQNIFMGHVIYIKPKFEFMAEGTAMRDQARGSNQPLYTSGGYAQISKAFGVLRPYFRYQWLNPNFHDPNNAWVGRWVGPDVGLRWDMNTFVALKTEYSHYDWKNFSQDENGNQQLPVQHKTINQVGMQLTYTF